MCSTVGDGRRELLHYDYAARTVVALLAEQLCQHAVTCSDNVMQRVNQIHNIIQPPVDFLMRIVFGGQAEILEDFTVLSNVAR